MSDLKILGAHAAPLRATPGHGVIGIDRAQVIRNCAKSIHDRALEGEKRMREQDAKWKYDEAESIVFIVERITQRGRRPKFRATSATEVGGKGHGQVFAEAYTIEGLTPELYYVLGCHFTSRKLVRDYEEGRARANKVAIHLDRSLALGSKG